MSHIQISQISVRISDFAYRLARAVVPHRPLGICAFSLALTFAPASVCAESLERARPAFVQTSQTQFTLDGRPFFVAGANNHYLTFGSSGEVERVLDDAVEMGANVVRTFIQPVIGSKDGTRIPTIWDWRSRSSSADLGVKGTYMLFFDAEKNAMSINDGPDGLGRLDFLVAAAKQRNLKLLIAFLDFWSYTGGIQQMAAWYGSSDQNTFFFSDPRCKNDYRAWVKSVLTRTNPITKIQYRDEPAIFGWELANEPDIKPHALLVEWTGEMATFIKGIDRNHLLATGRANMQLLPTDAQIPNIDFITWHGYPLYLGKTAAEFDALIGKSCDLAALAQKPILLEEFGLARSDPDQAGVYARWLKMIGDNAKCAGWLVWRLVSRQDDGRYPIDTHDQFDIRNDGSPAWNALKAAAKMRTN